MDSPQFGSHRYGLIQDSGGNDGKGTIFVGKKPQSIIKPICTIMPISALLIDLGLLKCQQEYLKSKRLNSENHSRRLIHRVNVK